MSGNQLCDFPLTFHQARIEWCDGGGCDLMLSGGPFCVPLKWAEHLERVERWLREEVAEEERKLGVLGHRGLPEAEVIMLDHIVREMIEGQDFNGGLVKE